MKVLIACEFSGIVREAFKSKGREAKCHKMPPSPDRWKDRSRTYTGIANAMAEQWG